MIKKKITLKKIRDETRKIACSLCNNDTKHAVHASVEVFWEVEEHDIQGKSLYEIISCLGCEELSFRLESGQSDDYYHGDGGQLVYNVSEEIYPSRLKGRSPLDHQYSLPDKVKTVYRETHAALCTKLKILSGVGIRALIEAVCHEEQAEGSNLKEKIDNLVKKGVLTAKNAETLHKTRFLGNRAAHEIVAATDSELEVAFDILENLLETVYIIPDKAKGLK